MSKQDGILDLTVKKEWFEKIKSGEKTHEYRVACKYRNRLGGENAKLYDKIRFRNGQLAPASDSKRVIYARIINISVINGKDTDLQIDRDVYDIEFVTVNCTTFCGNNPICYNNGLCKEVGQEIPF